VDALLEQSCSHVVNGVLYTLALCPRCQGSGTYKDFALGPTGLVSPVIGSDKLKQDILKIFATPSNPFHPDYRSYLFRRLNKSYTANAARTVVETDLRLTISTFMALQESNNASILSTEKVTGVVSVTTWVDPADPRRVYAAVVLEVEAGRVVKLETNVVM
jgi:hypothetical protein